MIFEKESKEFLEKIKPELDAIFKKWDKVAIKLHMGEKGNKTYIDPQFVKGVVKILKENCVEPFLFDSPVMYEGGRDTPEKYLKTAKENGFSEKEIGCPIIISNDFEYVLTPHLNAEVCKPLIEADGMLVLSHVKGHMCSGMGGAIKNLGMGAVSTKTKADIHNFSNPMVVGDCVMCETCVKACPVNAITAVAGTVVVNYDGCWGCGVCVKACPQNVLRPKIASFDTLISEAAFAVLLSVEKVYYVNVLKKISRLCDCTPTNGPIVAKDIGYIASTNIVEIDKESIDMVNREAKKNLFLELHNKDPYEHVKEMERLKKESIK